jgi:hypothetical protein
MRSLEDRVAEVTAFMERGVGYALPEPPRWGLDFGGAQYDVRFDAATGDLVATVTMPSTRGRHTSEGFGFRTAGQDVSRRLGEDAHDEALRAFARGHHAEIVADIREHLVDGTPHRLLGEAGVARAEIGEWEVASVREVSATVGNTVHVTPWGRSLPVVATIRASLARKAPVTETPFAGLSDRQIDEVIEEHIGPEGVTADGEYRGRALAARRRQLRERYRAMPPREQVAIWNRVKDHIRR